MEKSVKTTKHRLGIVIDLKIKRHAETSRYGDKEGVFRGLKRRRNKKS